MLSENNFKHCSVPPAYFDGFKTLPAMRLFVNEGSLYGPVHRDSRSRKLPPMSTRMQEVYPIQMQV